MDTNELRAQAIAEHEEDIKVWVEQKKANLKQSLVDRLANNQKEHEDIAAQLESLEDPAEEATETSSEENAEPQG